MWTTSASAIKSFWSDPFQWYIEFVIGRTLRRQPVALVAGIAWHHFMEALLSNVEREDAKRAMVNEFQAHVDDALSEGMIQRATGLNKELKVLALAADLWVDTYDVKTLAVERALVLPITLSDGTEARIVGRPDREIEWLGRIGHFQHRTLAVGKPLDLYLNTFHRNVHEGIYWKMMLREYEREPFGTMLSLVRKGTAPAMIARPHEYLQTHPINISREQADWSVDNAIATLDVMKAIQDGRLKLWSNVDNDLGRYGNSESLYVRAFTRAGWSGFDDDRYFVDVRDRYPELQENA